jgi:tetratricopeptide (TPR) repeat protein
MSPRAVSRFWFDEALRHMADHPGFAARAMLRKLGLFWNHFEISDNQDQYLLEEDSWVLRLPLLGFGHIAALALLGAVLTIRTRRDVRFLCAFVAVYCLSVVAFFMFSRYRIQVVPALLPLAALGATTLGHRAGARDWRGLATGGAVVLAGGLVTFPAIGVFWRDQPQVTEMRLCHLAEIYRTAGNPDRAIAAYQTAVASCPTCTQALAELTDTYAQTGRRADGHAWLRTFVRAHPEHPDGARHLARLQADAPRASDLPAP